MFYNISVKVKITSMYKHADEQLRPQDKRRNLSDRIPAPASASTPSEPLSNGKRMLAPNSHSPL